MSLLRKILEERSNNSKTYTDKLLEIVDDYEIYSSLLERDLNIGERILSPIRYSDDNPSFCIFVPTRTKKKIRPDEIWFKDLGSGDFGDVFEFSKSFANYQCNLNLSTRKEVIQFIDNQLELNLFSGNAKEILSVNQRNERRNLLEKNKKVAVIKYQSRDFSEKDLEYWSSMDIDQDNLNHYKIKSVRYLLDENNIVKKEFKKNELCFVYKIWDKLKIYQPLAHKAFKFRNTCPGDDYKYYQGYEQLNTENDILIITKSFKDLIVFDKYFNEFLNIPVSVIAPHAESINLSEEFIIGVKRIYKHIICVSDFDLAGVKFANRCKKRGFICKFISTKRTLINGKYKVLDKDISDFRINHGKFKTKKLLRSWQLDLL
jgi:hypothetical protein